MVVDLYYGICILEMYDGIKLKDLLIKLLSRDKADEIQLVAAKWYEIVLIWLLD